MMPIRVPMVTDLAAIADVVSVPILLVGASARILLCDDVISERGRATKDWDFGVQVVGWSQYEALRAALLSGPFARGPVEHRFVHRSGLKLDLIPFGGNESVDRHVTWPTAGVRMNVLGFREAHERAQVLDVGGSGDVRVVTLAGLLVLKGISYVDDPGRQHDLGDIDFMLRHAHELVGEQRVFDEAGEALRTERVAYTDAGTYCLGLDSGSAFTPVVTGPLEHIARGLEGPDSEETRRLRRQGSGVPDAAHAEEIAARWRALRLGIIDARN